jgi:hypothetical protein
LVHQASKAERQLQQDIKMSRAGPFNVKGATSASKFTPKSTGRSIVNDSSGGSYSNARSTSESKGFTPPSERNKPEKSSSISMGSTTKSSGIQCFKCGGRGHVIRECPNNRTIIINDKGDYESASEEEQEVNDEGKFQDTLEEEDHTYFEFETGAALVVAQNLSVQVKEAENGQWHNLFQTRAKAEGKVCNVIIDGGSCHNLASKEMVEKLRLKLLRLPHPYHVQWLNDSGDIKIRYKIKVPFKIGEYIDSVECDVVPMTVCHLLLGIPWQYDRSSLHCGRSNQYTIKWKGKEMVLKPMTPQQIHAENLQKSSEVKVQSEEEKEKKKMSALHKLVSESHKQNIREKKERRGR